MFNCWKVDPKVIGDAKETKKELECHDTAQKKEFEDSTSQQKNMITRLIAKNESLEINNTELMTVSRTNIKASSGRARRSSIYSGF